MLSRQEMFDKAYKGVIDQDGPGVIHGECAYLNRATGNMCGIGHVMLGQPNIPDAFWDINLAARQLRPTSIFRTKLSQPTPFESDDQIPWSKDDDRFAQLLQGAHDVAYETAQYTCRWGEDVDEYFINEFKHKMATLANEFHLKVPG